MLAQERWDFLTLFLKKTTKLDNDFFGKIEFYEDWRNSLKSYFRCKRSFDHYDQLVEIAVEADLNGPSQKQIAFFKGIEDNYSAIVEKISSLIDDEFRQWENSPKIEDFRAEFAPVYIQIPKCENKPIIWEIDFESYLDKNHIITLVMSDFNAQNILIDG